MDDRRSTKAYLYLTTFVRSAIVGLFHHGCDAISSAVATRSSAHQTSSGEEFRSCRRRIMFASSRIVLLAIFTSTGAAQVVTQYLPPPPPPEHMSMSVTVSTSPTSIYVGGTFSLSATVTLTDAVSTLANFSGSCTAPDYDFPLSFSPTGTGTFPNYHSTDTQSVEASNEAGNVTLTCSVTANLNNGTSDTASGSATFTVISCQGQVNAIAAPNVVLTGQAANFSTWSNLTGTVQPAGNVTSPVSTTGNGITGILEVSGLYSYLYDCDGDFNDNISEQDASIEGFAQAPANGQVEFTWTVTSYTYNLANTCESCEANPNGHYPITTTTPSVMPNAANSSQYCQ
jgi:hypothetical protein